MAWIDDHQARAGTGIVVIVVFLFGLAVLIWGGEALDFEKVKALLSEVALGASGIAASIIVLWLIFAHNDTWWGNAKDSIAFIAIGAVLTFIASAIELAEAFSKVAHLSGQIVGG